MIYWYRAVCFEHKETITLFVDCPTATAMYLKDRDQQIKDWLLKHFGCELKLYTIENSDPIWEAGCVDPIEEKPAKAFMKPPPTPMPTHGKPLSIEDLKKLRGL